MELCVLLEKAALSRGLFFFLSLNIRAVSLRARRCVGRGGVSRMEMPYGSSVSWANDGGWGRRKAGPRRRLGEEAWAGLGERCTGQAAQTPQAISSTLRRRKREVRVGHQRYWSLHSHKNDFDPSLGIWHRGNGNEQKKAPALRVLPFHYRRPEINP